MRVEIYKSGKKKKLLPRVRNMSQEKVKQRRKTKGDPRLYVSGGKKKEGRGSNQRNNDEGGQIGNYASGSSKVT